MKILYENSIFKNIRFFIPVIIIFSSLKTFGYVSAFILYIPYLIKNKNKILYVIRKSNLLEKQVLIFFLFILFEIFYGCFFIKDIRIVLFWIPLLLVIVSSYFKNIYDLKKNKFYKKNYLKIIYKSCTFYFFLYFILNLYSYIKYGAFYRIQDYLWMGSSSAFAISSILFYSMSNLWQKNGFKVLSSYGLFLIFYIFLVLINETRLGIVYISLFLIYLVLKNIQLRNYLNSIFIFLTIFLSYTILSFFINQFHIKYSNNIGFTNRNLDRNLVEDSKNIFMKDNRKKEIIKGFQKFEDYPKLNKLIGTGWYSSRITINLNTNDIKLRNFSNKKVTYLQGIVAMLLDTGIIGSVFAFYLFFINLFNTLASREELINKSFILLLLLISFLCLFIGYPLVNIAYILFLLPGGVIQEVKDN